MLPSFTWTFSCVSVLLLKIQKSPNIFLNCFLAQVPFAVISQYQLFVIWKCLVLGSLDHCCLWICVDTLTNTGSAVWLPCNWQIYLTFQTPALCQFWIHIRLHITIPIGHNSYTTWLFLFSEWVRMCPTRSKLQWTAYSALNVFHADITTIRVH